MPQMFPMNWITLSTLFILLLLMISFLMLSLFSQPQMKANYSNTTIKSNWPW
uniref:ATP synthetase F0 Subunit 8 n=1 Tax=Abacion magnum TaxID=118452 RepID=S4T1J4_ABAMA|nr:ATP synthase F0 subunit 8 [Abacion magnum]AFR77013.1 ATP synthetase F0 Subunit 8 [Abacion magnum]